jgi:phosphoglycolate phosphatase-like HAD superfamily hydrolase
MTPTTPPPDRPAPTEGGALPMIGSTSQYAEVGRPVAPEEPVEPRQVKKGVVAFDLDGTLLDDIGAISAVAADVFLQSFGTPPEEGRVHYLATTGLPFEAQLAQLYPGVAEAERKAVARTFHERKIREAYVAAKPFPEVPRMLKRLSSDHWTMVISTGAEREMADLLLEREGLRFWFEGVLGSGQGTKREHLKEYQRRYPGARMFLVGDSRFDMEAARDSPGVRALGRASRLPNWTLGPEDLARWGAVWSDYSLAHLPEALESFESTPSGGRASPTRRKRAPPTRHRP